MSKYVYAAVLIGPLSVAMPCFVSDKVGHRVIGWIASSLLTPAAQRWVATVLDVDNTKAAVRTLTEERLAMVEV